MPQNSNFDKGKGRDTRPEDSQIMPQQLSEVHYSIAAPKKVVAVVAALEKNVFSEFVPPEQSRDQSWKDMILSICYRSAWAITLTLASFQCTTEKKGLLIISWLMCRRTISVKYDFFLQMKLWSSLLRLRYLVMLPSCSYMRLNASYRSWRSRRF